MDFDRKIEHAFELVKNLKSEHECAKEFTQTFLNVCAEENIDAVCVGVKNKIVDASVEWPFGHGGSVFGSGYDETGTPSIWRVVEKLRIGNGAGNTGQHQADLSKLINGTYQLRDGKWLRVD